MKQKHAFILSILLTIFLTANILFFSSSDSTRKTVTIDRVIDGDTIETSEGMIIRLANINTPEKSHPGFEEATNFLKKY
ncbi:MAG: hypothetical protein KC506_02735, partial [Nanoarchaeota archaeon]|nr:hypothetical protein [Nanoarchaeota archaeon]